MTIGEVFDRAVTLLALRWRAAAAIAVLASLPAALSELAVLEDVHAPFLMLTLRALQLLGQIYGFAALVALFAQRDARDVVREGWLRLLRTALLAAIPLVAAGAVAAAALSFAMALLAVAGARVIVTAPIGLALFLAAIVPVMFVAQLAIANSVLDGTRATTSVMAAYERAFAAGERRRTALLAYAATMTYALPVFVIGGAIEAVAHGSDVWWPLVALPPLRYALGVTFYAAVLAVAAQDYTVRREGRDLEGVLDGLESA